MPRIDDPMVLSDQLVAGVLGDGTCSACQVCQLRRKPSGRAERARDLGALGSGLLQSTLDDASNHGPGPVGHDGNSGAERQHLEPAHPPAAGIVAGVLGDGTCSACQVCQLRRKPSGRAERARDLGALGSGLLQSTLDDASNHGPGPVGHDGNSGAERQHLEPAHPPAAGGDERPPGPDREQRPHGTYRRQGEGPFETWYEIRQQRHRTRNDERDKRGETMTTGQASSSGRCCRSSALSRALMLR